MSGGEKEIKARWLKWNARGEGKNRSPIGAGGRYSYHGQILYSHNWPVARLMKGKGKDWVCLTKSGVKPVNPKEWDKSPRLAITLAVTDVGAYSKFPEDVIPDDQMHERMKWLIHLEAQSLVAYAEEGTASQLVIKPKYNSTGSSRLRDKMIQLRKVYENYDEAFGLKWPDWPKTYNENLFATIERRRRAYTDPKAVEKRERQAARTAAKKAFNLEQDA